MGPQVTRVSGRCRGFGPCSPVSGSPERPGHRYGPASCCREAAPTGLHSVAGAWERFPWPFFSPVAALVCCREKQHLLEEQVLWPLQSGHALALRRLLFFLLSLVVAAVSLKTQTL